MQLLLSKPPLAKTGLSAPFTQSELSTFYVPLTLQLPSSYHLFIILYSRFMASPAHPSHPAHQAAYPQRYRRSSFNGAKQLSAFQAPGRRVLLAVGLLAATLLATVGVIAFHLAAGN